MGHAFPVQPVSPLAILAGEIEGSLEQVSKHFNAEKKKALSPFQKAGVMVNRVYWTTNVIPEWDGDYLTLGQMLQPNKQVDASFKISKDDLDKWTYLKGAKREPRQNKALGYTYTFSEGALAFPDPLDRPSRTIITGEGGASPSRTKHAVKLGRTLRRLTPVELERLNMFPDDHTKLVTVSDGRRAFSWATPLWLVSSKGWERHFVLAAREFGVQKSSVEKTKSFRTISLTLENWTFFSCQCHPCATVS